MRVRIPPGRHNKKRRHYGKSLYSRFFRFCRQSIYYKTTSRLKDAMVFASKEDADKFITDKMLDNNWVVLEVI